MLFKNYLNQVSNLWAENRLFKFVLIMLTLIIVYLSYQLASLSSSVRTVIVPLGVDKEMTIDSEKVDRNYLKSMGTYLAYMLYTFTDANVVEHYTNLKPMFENGDLANELIKLAQTYQDKHINYSNLAISNIDYRKGEVIITGNLIQEINKIPVRNEEISFIIEYKIKYGRFFITSYQELKQPVQQINN